MNFKLYRSIIKNLVTGRDVWARKLVIESSMLFEDGDKRVHVYCVAYSGEPRCEVVFEVEPHDAPAYEARVEAINAALFDCAERGEGPLMSHLFELWLDLGIA